MTNKMRPAAPSTEAGSEDFIGRCLDLLRGPSDDHKFAGMLLATKLLPSGGQASLRLVIEALGLEFLERLLEPLQCPAESATLSNGHSKEMASCALSIAVLSGCSRLESVAGSSMLLRQVPALVRIIHARGLSPIFNNSVTPRSFEDDVLEDTLRCLAFASHSSFPVRNALWDSSVVAACSAILLDEMATEACLAAVYTLLKELLSSPDFTSSRCPILIKKRRHQCGLLVSVLAKHVSFPSAGSTSSMAGAVDQAMLQLQAVYTLVLLLQPWTQTEGAAAVRTCIDATCTDWSLCVRQGVHLLVVGRVGMSQRHAALRLSALMVEMFGSGWLFGIGHPAQANPGSTFAQRTLILPIVEIAKVELAVLLHDLAAPDHRVWEDNICDQILDLKLDPAPSTQNCTDNIHDAISNSGARGTHCMSRERARGLVPACLTVLEAAIFALISNGNSDCEEHASAIDRIFSSLSAAVDVALQFLEDAESIPQSQDAEEPLHMCALRFVAKFAAEALPICEARLSSILPFLLSLQGHTGTPSQGVYFMLPVFAAALTCKEQDVPELGTVLWEAIMSAKSMDHICRFLEHTSTSVQSLLQKQPSSLEVVEAHQNIADVCAVLVMAFEQDCVCDLNAAQLLSVSRLAGRASFGPVLQSLWSWGRSLQSHMEVGRSCASTISGQSSSAMPSLTSHVDGAEGYTAQHALPIVSSGCLCASILRHAISSCQLQAWEEVHMRSALQHMIYCLEWGLRSRSRFFSPDTWDEDSEMSKFLKRTLVLAKECCSLDKSMKLIARSCHWLDDATFSQGHPTDELSSLKSELAQVLRQS